MKTSILKVVDIPRDRQAIADCRINKRARSFSDIVDPIFTELLATDDKFKPLIDASEVEDTVEGSYAADDHAASLMIREFAKSNGVVIVASAKINVIAKALRTVKKRFGMGRAQLRANRAEFAESEV